jgi:hypothetical protein
VTYTPPEVESYPEYINAPAVTGNVGEEALPVTYALPEVSTAKAFNWELAVPSNVE